MEGLWNYVEFGDVNTVANIMNTYYPSNYELWRDIGRYSAEKGHLPMMMLAMEFTPMNLEELAVIARNYGKWHIARYLTGNDTALELMDQDDIEEDMRIHAESWENGGGIVFIKGDMERQQLEVDTTTKHKDLGTHMWGYQGDDLELPMITRNESHGTKYMYGDFN